MYFKRIISAIATASCVAIIASACEAGDKKETVPTPAPKSSSQDAQVPPAVTNAQARQVLDYYTQVNNRAITSLDINLESTVDTDSVLASDRADFKIQRNLHKPFSALSYRAPRFL